MFPGQYMYVIRERLKLQSEVAMYFYVNNKLMTACESPLQPTYNTCLHPSIAFRVLHSWLHYYIDDVSTWMCTDTQSDTYLSAAVDIRCTES